MPLPTTKISTRPLLRVLLPSAARLLSSAPAPAPAGGASSDARTQKLERIADELLSLTKAERDDYSILFRLKLGLNQWIPAGGVLAPGAVAGPAAEAAKPAEEKEKTAFDIKLEKFDAASKIKVIKEVRTFTDLGLKEAKELVEKTPVVLKKGVTKEEAEAIAAKLKEVGATIVLEIHHQIIMFEVGILTTHSIIYAKSALWMCFNFQGSPAMQYCITLLHQEFGLELNPCKPATCMQKQVKLGPVLLLHV
ncbi:uncharacterized protein [Elaeis guineensis]|uniref:uncharacterized protein isoform X3 n=1 Tax=Elaeis guineensis var. tenera TaxID=51953 RepID=UPI003C6CCA39